MKKRPVPGRTIFKRAKTLEAPELLAVAENGAVCPEKVGSIALGDSSQCFALFPWHDEPSSP